MGVFDSVSNPAPQQQQSAQGGVFGGANQTSAAPQQQASGGVFGSAPPTMKQAQQAAAAPGIIPPSILPPPSPKIGTGITKALDFQRNAVAKKLTGKNTYDEQMAAMRHHIPGMEPLYGMLQQQNPAIGPNMGPLEGFAQAGGRFMHQAARGIIDASIAAATDPLTYETMAAGPILGIIGRTAKGAAALKAIQNVYMNSKLTAPLYDFTHWAGAVERGGKYPSAYLRGAAHKSEGEGGAVSGQMQRIYDTAMQGISPESRVRINQVKNANDRVSMSLKEAGQIPDQEVREAVQNAIRHGEEPVVPDHAKDVEAMEHYQAITKKYESTIRPQDLTPEENKGLRRLNVLTKLDLEMRRMGYATIEARSIKDPATRQAVWEAIRTGKAPADQRANQLYDSLKREAEEKVPERVSYFPEKHVGQKAEGRAGMKFNVSEHFDPRTLERQDTLVTNPKQVQEGYQAMFTNAGRVRSQMVLNRVLDTALDNPEVKKVFEQEIPATGNFRTDFEKFKDGLRTIVGYPRAATVSMSPRHGVNIGDLFANTVPPDKVGQAVKEVSVMFSKMLTASPKEYELLTKEGRETFGTMGTGFAEHKPFFQHFPDEVNIPFSGGKTLQMPKQIAGKEVPILARWTRFNNKVVWALDQAIKTVYAKIIKQSGEAANIAAKYGKKGDEQFENLVAGGLSQERLVDYSRRTGLQNFLRHIAPFGTFRGGIPQAVGGGIIRNPARAAFLSRASGGAMYGARPDTKQGGSGYVMSNPTADVGELSGYFGGDKNPFEGPGRFLKATAGNLPADIGGFGANVIEQGGPHPPNMWRDPMAYGQQWLPGPDRGRFDLGVLASQAVAGVLEAQQALEALGFSRYQIKNMAAEATRQVTGVQYQAPQP